MTLERLLKRFNVELDEKEINGGNLVRINGFSSYEQAQSFLNEIHNVPDFQPLFDAKTAEPEAIHPWFDPQMKTHGGRFIKKYNEQHRLVHVLLRKLNVPVTVSGGAGSFLNVKGKA